MYIVTSNVDSSEAVHDCMSEFWMFIIFVDILCVYTYSSIYCIVQNEDETRNESVVAVAAVPLVLRKQVPEGCQVQPKFHIYICYIYIYIYIYIYSYIYHPAPTGLQDVTGSRSASGQNSSPFICMFITLVIHTYVIHIYGCSDLLDPNWLMQMITVFPLFLLVSFPTGGGSCL